MNDSIWQNLVALTFAVVAVIYLLYRARQALRGRNTGCHRCPGHSCSSQPLVTIDSRPPAARPATRR